VLAAVALTLAGCAGYNPFDTRPDIERTWDAGRVALPGTAANTAIVTVMDSRAMQRRIARLRPGETLPIVIYLHGCTGIGNQPFMEALARRGYVVVAPDSLARRYRPLQCDPEHQRGGYNLFVYDFRSAELTYALQRLAGLPWVDRDNLFLVGNSEGGVVAALYRGDEFNARVITQWTCEGAPLVRGIGAPADTPILAIVHGHDPWYGGKKSLGQQGDCGRFMKGRPGSQSLVLAQGKGHGVFNNTYAVKTILAFIDANRQR
jgi:dienelactone hydrolase